MTLEGGIKFPLTLTATLNTEVCLFPYLYASFEIPIRMYFAFSGLEVFDFTIIKSRELEIPIKTFTFPSFCVGRSNHLVNSMAEEIFTIIIKNENFYEEISDDAQHLRKQLVVGVHSDTDFYDYSRYPLQLYPTDEEPIYDDRLYFATDLTNQFNFTWRIDYINQDNELKSSEEIELPIGDIEFTNNKALKHFEISLQDGKDKTFLDAEITKAQLVHIGEPFSPKANTFCAVIPNKYGTLYSILYNDENTLKQDSTAFFYKDLMLNRSFGSPGTFDIQSTQYYLYFRYLYSNSTDKCRLHLDFSLTDFESTIEIGSFYTPLFSDGNYTNGEFNWDHDWIAAFDIDTSQELVVSGSLIYENGSSVSFHTYLIDLRYSGSIISYENIKVYFSHYSAPNVLIAESTCSHTMMIIETITATHSIVSADSYGYIFLVTFQEDEYYKKIIFPISQENHGHKLFLIHTAMINDDPITFHGDIVNLIANDLVYINIDKETEISIMISRNLNSIDSYYIHAIFCDFDEDSLVLSYQGADINLGSSVPTLVLVPLYNYYINFIFNDTGRTNIRLKRYPLYGESSPFYEICLMISNINKTVKFQLTVSMLNDREPYLDVDFSANYQQFYYGIVSTHSNLLKCEFNDTVLFSEVTIPEVGAFEFVFTKSQFPKLTHARFSAVCHDNLSGVACEIEYPPPSESGYHLIHYPNRDGISITGRGFLSELIPVEANKSFIYYKTYPEPIEIIRTYSTEEIEHEKITVKVMDQKQSDIANFTRYRKICLLDSKQQIVPFSRKCIEKDMNAFLNMIGVTEKVDFNYFINDENGCIVFDPKYIASNTFRIQKQVCDFFTENGTEMLNDFEKEIIFAPGGQDPSQRKKMILIICLFALFVLLIMTLLIALCIRKWKKRKEKVEDHSTINESLVDWTNAD